MLLAWVLLNSSSCPECEQIRTACDLLFGVVELVEENTDVTIPFDMDTPIVNDLLDNCERIGSIAGATSRVIVAEKQNSNGIFEPVQIVDQDGVARMALDVPVESLENGEEATYRDRFSFEQPGVYAIVQEVDPNEIIEERNEDNNTANPVQGTNGRVAFRYTIEVKAKKGTIIDADTPPARYYGTRRIR